VTSPQAPRQTAPVEYKGEPLDAARGPGLGCFWLQIAVLAALIVVTPLSAMTWGWPIWATVVLFVAMMLLLLLSGQTMIFLLRIVAAGREEGRRRPLASVTPTVGQLEDEAVAEDRWAGADEAGAGVHGPRADAADDGGASAGNDGPAMRQ
jgi:hypothetical protein